MAHYPAVPEAQASVPRIEKNKMVYIFCSMIFSFSFWSGSGTFYGEVWMIIEIGFYYIP